MKELNELDIAGLRVDFRHMYQIVGYEGSMRCLYEMIMASNILIEVIAEELDNDQSKRH